MKTQQRVIFVSKTSYHFFDSIGPLQVEIEVVIEDIIKVGDMVCINVYAILM